MNLRASFIVVLCGALFAGCGLKGPLYMPDKQQPVPATNKNSDESDAEKKKSASPSGGDTNAPPTASATDSNAKK